MARLFVAVDLPRAVRDEAARVAKVLRATVPEVQWVPPHNLHITLAFLGRTSMVPAVSAAVQECAARCAPIALHLDGAGAFPSEQRARVLWVGLGGDIEALASLAAVLWEGLEPLGFEPEARAFSAHLTIGRLRVPQGVDLSGVSVEPLPLPVEAVTLFESKLQRPAPVYQPVVVAPLGG